MSETVGPVQRQRPSAAEVIEDIHPLSPLQQGLLFHTLREAGSAVYLSQTTALLSGLDPVAFRRSWEQTVAWHPALRSAFLWEGADEPVQVVYRRLPVRFHTQDWRGLPPEVGQRRLADFLYRDRNEPFQLSRAPLARYALLRLGEDDYQFVWTYHAILLDGWSTAMVMRDLVRHGAATRAGDVVPSPDRAPYRDFVEWTRLRDHDDAQRHWRRTLRGFTKPTPLPVTGPGGSDRAGRTGVAEHTALLSPAETERVSAAARAYRVPLGVIVQGAWALALMRYAGVDDVVFGQVVSGRGGGLPGVQDMVGLLTNTVPVRVAARPGDRVGAWLRGLHARQSAALEYEHTPLSQVQRCSELSGGQELFQTVLVVQNYPRLDETGQIDPGYRVSGLHGFETTHYPITVFAVPGERLAIRMVHDRATVDGGSAALLAESVLTALTGLAAGADRPVSTVPVFGTGTSAHHRLRDEVNSTEHRFPPPHTVAELFAAQAGRTPDEPAVIDAASRLSYRALDERADRLARTLVEQGARAGERVAVLLERSVDFVTAALAVLKSGAAYVPVDPGYPAARIAWMIEDGGCRTVLTRSGLLDRLPASCGAAVRTVCLDSPRPGDGAGGDAPARPLPPRAHPDDLAYVIYTSGSTGTPKGVMVSHRAVLNTLRWMEQELGCGPGDVVAFKTPVSFTDSVCEVLWPLCHGAALAVFDDATVRDPDALYEALDRYDVTYCQFVPRQLDLFMAVAARRGGDDPLPRLRRVFNGGEPLPQSFAVEWDKHFRNGRIANIYGMTESAIYATYQALPRGFAERRGAVPIGRPIANTQVHVLNRELEPCPPGVVGELFVGGAGLARGYLGRPGLTAERFVPDLFGGGGSGGRLYRTGDLVRWSVDGGLEFVGRVDFQVKVRGFRVELGEVESVLGGHRGVRDAVVVARSGGGGGAVRLVAYVVASGEGGGVGVEELREFVGSRLPEYMVPGVFVWLGSLPLTVNGKVDRERLPVPEGERPRLGQRFVEPRTSAERVLAGLWSEVLGVSRIGVHDNFFTLGGDSLMAVRVVGRIREAFPADYTLPEMFAAPSIAGCAAAVERLLSDAADLDALVDEVAGLSDEEIAARLAEGGKSHE
ncbi:non-ribosomal peptide synthetase [Actinomadura mexicana]|uniref:Amino acid adenylation domain-containing protein n=1 Tax=Actinomadura mexicana TaxID=134959 RepID=A0A238VML9_9ACTN|nr:non-ribosomal peptide synthetase [Actinomadura mexicana]SNR35476.1 amino acid adenylation domain-containing protein [Actinomadura mexicana]